jgi:hypothetical protein
MKTRCKFNYTLSQAIAAKIAARPKACWANALTALRSQKQLHDAFYVEGWFLRTAEPLPIEHGWIELKDGTIVDPTVVVVLDDQHESYAYFPGVRYTQEDLKGVRVSQLPYVWKFGGWGGFRYKPYREAYQQACKYTVSHL